MDGELKFPALGLETGKTGHGYTTALMYYLKSELIITELAVLKI